MDKMLVGTVSGSIDNVTVPKHGIKLWKLVPQQGQESAQKRSADGLDRVTRDFAEMKPSRIMGSHAF
jgi:alpha-galactosidase